MNDLIRKTVKRKGRSKWEYGIIIDTVEFGLAIKYDKPYLDIEELEGLPYTIVDEYTFKYLSNE